MYSQENANFCLFFSTSSNKEKVGRIVFGEARGESSEGQLAVAYTVVNRVAHDGYPSTLDDVVYQKYGSHYQYNTLDHASHKKAWKKAKKDNAATYTNAITAASGALCGTESDPTTCATDFCAEDPCSATNDNKYWIAYNKQQIGSHWFVCRKAAK